MLDRSGGGEGDRHEQCGQHHEWEGNSVDAQMPVDPPGLVPRGPLDELESGDPGFEAREQEPGQSERRQRESDADRHEQLRTPFRQEPDNDGAQCGQQYEGGQHNGCPPGSVVSGEW